MELEMAMQKHSKVLLLAVTFAVAWREDPGRLLAAEGSQQYLSRMKELDRSIKEEIGEPRASHLSQCRSIPFGAKACGGPATFLAYSVARTDESGLRTLIDDYNQNARRYNQTGNLISDCMVVSEPKLELVGGICKLQWDQPVPIK
jgi:hypothetical protein